MTFHFTSFSLTSPYHRFSGFEIDVPGGGVPFPLDIVVYSQPVDRYTAKKGLLPSVVVCICGPQLAIVPVDYDGFIVERSADGGQTWLDVSGVVRDSFVFVDFPASVGVYFYRAKMQLVSSLQSGYGNVVQVTVGSWNNCDVLGLNEINASDGVVLHNISNGAVFPYGFDSDIPAGMSLSEGSLAGSYTGGSWYISTKEFAPPDVYSFIPVCGDLNVALPITQITFSIQDQPHPVGGSGIDDNYLFITLSVTSQYGGSPIIVRQGLVEPASPLITCLVVPGAVPALDRDVTITFPAGYVVANDLVTVEVIVRDLDGNETISSCVFQMEDVDIVPPEILEESPVCGFGLTGDQRAPRNTSFSFKVTDDDSGVNQNSIDVYYGFSNIGPWFQVLNNGLTFIAGFWGSVTSDGSGGFDVVINRPVNDLLWAADTEICFRVLAEDIEGNAVEKICCFKTADEVSVSRVVPLSENILFVEFSSPMLNFEALRNPINYNIIAVDTGIDPVIVRNVIPQQFLAADDVRKLDVEFGEGSPTFVYLETSTNSFWGQYQLTVNGDSVLDEFGGTMKVTGRTAIYRGRRTKVDDGLDNIGGSAIRDNSVVRQLVLGISHSDEQIGGVFKDDDWD